MHYVAVNARTKETMGSVPIHIPKLLGVSFCVEVLGFLSMLWIDWEYNWIFLFAGIIYFIFIYVRYRNSNARHKYESETKRAVSNLKNTDAFIDHRKGLTNSKIHGANNNKVSNQSLEDKVLDSFNINK